jgi:hypothetical protein
MLYHGPESIPRMPKAAVLNSRQSKRPLGSDGWIVNTLRAVRYAAGKGYVILSGTGISTYEFVNYAAARYGCPLIITLPSSDNPSGPMSEIITDFKLNPDKTGFYFIDRDKMRGKSGWLDRDEKIISTADVLIPISIRENGNLNSMISGYSPVKTIMDDFKMQYVEQPRVLKEDYSELRIVDWARDDKWNYIAHWCRTSNGPWPGESRYDYYHAIAQSTGRYPRSAIDTLCRILSEKKLRASPKHLHKGVEAVAFSGLKPTDVIRLMRWRPRFVNMNFEPYGIAVERDYAEKIGIRRVLYGSPEMYEILPDKDKPYFHSLGEKTEWAVEREYRHHGDLRLNGIPPDKMIVITKTGFDVEVLKNYTDSKILPLFE